MSYELTDTVFEDYVLVCVDGTWPAKREREILAKIYETWAKNQKCGLIIDVRHMGSTPSVVDDYYTGKILAEIGFRKIPRIAILDEPWRKNVNSFLETTTTNRGINMLFFYRNGQDAVKWIEDKTYD